MKLLLDTHILVWTVLEPGRLKPALADRIESDDTEVWVSPVSAWECLTLAEKGRLALQPNANAWFRSAVAHLGAHEAPINFEVALLSRSIGLSHNDLADRLLAATAAIYDFTLVTADSKLLAGTGFSVMGNA